jgi:4-carboxymuconolactone decarboxylase
MGLPIENTARGPGAPGWTPLEQALLTAADDLYRDSCIPDRTWSNPSSRFDTSTIVSAPIRAAPSRQAAIALTAFGVQLEPGDERVP